MYDDDDQKQSKPVFFHKYKHPCMIAMPLLVSIGNIKYLIKRRNTEKKKFFQIFCTHIKYTLETRLLTTYILHMHKKNLLKNIMCHMSLTIRTNNRCAYVRGWTKMDT